MTIAVTETRFNDAKVSDRATAVMETEVHESIKGLYRSELIASTEQGVCSSYHFKGNGDCLSGFSIQKVKDMADEITLQLQAPGDILEGEELSLLQSRPITISSYDYQDLAFRLDFLEAHTMEHDYSPGLSNAARKIFHHIFRSIAETETPKDIHEFLATDSTGKLS